MSHSTRCGVAVADTMTPPAAACAVTGCQLPGSTHSQVGTLTTVPCWSDGLKWTAGLGIGTEAAACCARAARSTGFAPHVTVADDIPLASSQLLRYQVPGPGG